MSKKINFVTLFPGCPNFGLVKDVGQIPYVLGEGHDDIHTQFVSCKLDKDGPYMDKVKGLEVVHYPHILKSDMISGVVYLLFNARKIDWLNVYHCGRRSFLWAKIFKSLNPKGKVYLKLDLDFISCEMFDKNQKERNLFSKVTQYMDLVTVESKAILDRVQKYTNKKIKIMHNGFYKTEGFNLLRERENTFITVGRLGTEQKATDVLLEAFAKTAISHNWKLKLIGTIEEDFKKYINEYYIKNPEMVERVQFLGSIEDRVALYDEYSLAKVFVLPSRWESFGIVGPEALSCGCRIIVSDKVPPMYEVTNNTSYGDIVPSDDIDALAECMLKYTKYDYQLEQIMEMSEYAMNYFSWEKICEMLHDYLFDSETKGED